jgi:hypothetical protein
VRSELHSRVDSLLLMGTAMKATGMSNRQSIKTLLMWTALSLCIAIACNFIIFVFAIRTYYKHIEYRFAENNEWPIDVPNHWPAASKRMMSQLYSGALKEGQVYAEKRGRHTYIIWTEKIGWPRNALKLEQMRESESSSTSNPYDARISYPNRDSRAFGIGSTSYPFNLRIPLNPVGLYSIPTEIIWQGLITNLAVFSFLVIILRLGFLITRRIIRHGRRQCYCCGYSIVGLPDHCVHCPECGCRRDPTRIKL